MANEPNEDIPSFDWEAELDKAKKRPFLYRRDGTPYLGKDKPAALEWANDYEAIANRIVARDRTTNGETISTVWLGINQALFGPPLIFETIVFGPPQQELDSFGNPQRETLEMERYSTEEEALRGHKEILSRRTSS